MLLRTLVLALGLSSAQAVLFQARVSLAAGSPGTQPSTTTTQPADKEPSNFQEWIWKNWRGPVILWSISGAVAGFMLKQLLTRKQLQKLTQEIVNLRQSDISEAGKMMSIVQSARADWVRAQERVARNGQALMRLIQDDPTYLKAITEKREELYQSIVTESLLFLQTLVEYEVLVRRHQPDDIRNFIETRVIPDIEYIAEYVEIVNSDAFISRKMAPLKIRSATCQPFLDFLKQVGTFERPVLEPKLRKAIEQLQSA
jgi:hypothetical protein